MAGQPDPIRTNGGSVDLSTRFVRTGTVSASPSAATITQIGSVSITSNVVIASGVQLWGWAAFTAGTNGVSAKLDIRQTSTTGSVIATTGLVTVTAASLYALTVEGFDTAATLPNQTYALCLTVTSGSAASTVSSLSLAALVV